MKALLIAAAVLASTGVMAHPHDGRHVGCNVHSDYSVGMHRRAFVFSRDSSAPVQIGLGGGRLFINGKEQDLSESDHRRLGQMEAEMQVLVPEVEQITTEAIEIAFTALTEVARGLSSDPGRTVASLDAAHQRMRREMGARPLAIFNDDAIGDVITPILQHYVPDIVGGAVRAALKAAFSSGTEAAELKVRMERMERELDGKVDARAKRLEPLAASMCQRLRRIDDIDDSLDFRLPDGAALQLLRVDPDHRN